MLIHNHSLLGVNEVDGVLPIYSYKESTTGTEETVEGATYGLKLEKGTICQINIHSNYTAPLFVNRTKTGVTQTNSDVAVWRVVGWYEGENSTHKLTDIHAFTSPANF